MQDLEVNRRLATCTFTENRCYLFNTLPIPGSYLVGGHLVMLCSLLRLGKACSGSSFTTLRRVQSGGACSTRLRCLAIDRSLAIVYTITVAY